MEQNEKVRKHLLKAQEFLQSNNNVPAYLYLELTSVCNAKCVFCPYKYNKWKPRGIISDKFFYDAIDQYRDMGGRRANFTPMQGEPFLDKNILEKIRYVKDFDVIHTYTNAIALSRFELDELLESGLTSISISTAVPDRESFFKTFGVDKYDIVINNINRLLRAFTDSQNKTLKRISIEFRSYLPLSEIFKKDDFKKFIQPYLSNKVSVSCLTNFDSWGGIIKKDDLLNGMVLNPVVKQHKMIPCVRIYNMDVTIDGDMRLCGCRFDPFSEIDDFHVGNIQKISLKEAFNSQKAKSLVASFPNLNNVSLCQKCSWYELPTDDRFFSQSNQQKANKEDVINHCSQSLEISSHSSLSVNSNMDNEIEVINTIDSIKNAFDRNQNTLIVLSEKLIKAGYWDQAEELCNVIIRQFGKNPAVINLLECIRRDRGTEPLKEIENKEKVDAERDTDTNVTRKSLDTVPSPPQREQRLRFLQIHTFYAHYLNNYYKANSSLSSASFKEQIDDLLRDGFSAIHMFAPYMNELEGYEAQLIIANNPYSQQQWMRENHVLLTNDKDWMYEVSRRQIEHLKPDVLYLSDPITFDSRFVRSLFWKPSLIIGWRAANIPEGTDWSEFDIMLSSLSALRETALTLGSKSAEHFFPGFPVFINKMIRDVQPSYDVVFSGQWTLNQHPRRNHYLTEIAKAASQPGKEFSCAYYLSGQTDKIPPEVAKYNLGAHFGISMHRALRSGRIAIDARGILETKNSAHQETTDLAAKETANMRIFEVTGSGVFLLTEYFENLSQYFEPGKEIETFRDEKELIDKIHYYLANPDKREAIAQRGHERCLREYSMQNRALEFDKIIRKHLAQTTPQTNNKNSDNKMIRKEINKEGWDTYAHNFDKYKKDEKIPGLVSEDHTQVQYLGDEWNVMCKAMRHPYGINVFSVEEFAKYLNDHFVSPYLPEGNNLNIMEIGPGGGRVTQLLLPRCQHLYAIDISTEMLNQLKQRFQDETKIQYIITNGSEIKEIPPASLDVMVSFDAFVHIEPYEIFRYLEITKSLLKENGIGIIHFSDMETPIGFQKFRDDVPSLVQSGASFYTFSAMCKSIMHKFLEELGFEIITITNDIIPRDAVAVFQLKGNQKKNHQNIEMLLEQAVKHLNANDNTEALALLDNAISLNPENHSALYGRAVALARLGRMDEATDTLESLLSVEPNHEKAQVLLNEITVAFVSNLMVQAANALNANKNNEAFALLNKAKSLRKPAQGLDYLRAIYFLRINQPVSAREALQEELRYFPNNEDAKKVLNQVSAQYPQLASPKIDDPEFQELLQLIRPYTMLSEERLFSLFSLAKRVCVEDIPGNFVECGVAAGGSTALLATIIKRYSKRPRWHYAFDSFEGMPTPTEQDKDGRGVGAEATGWGTGTCAAPEESVKEICAKLDVSDIVKPVKGYFESTLPKMRDNAGMIALLHTDGDWYESTKAVLHNLYDHVVNNGFIQVDDYGYWQGCKKAIHEFESSRKVQFEINQIDGTGVWFRKPDKFPVNESIPSSLVTDFQSIDPSRKRVDSQMSQNERFQLYYTVRELLPAKSSPLRFVEIGSWAGASLLLIHAAIKQRTPNVQGFSIEPGGQPQFYEVLKHLSNEVSHLRMFSHQAAPQLKQFFEKDGNFPEFIFIDGSHVYEDVRRDITDYFPLLAPGGIMVFHDYLPALNDENREAIFSHHGGKEPGIRQACQELMENTFHCEVIDIPLLCPTDPTQTQPHLPIIPGVFSTIRAYRKSV